jgi:hypothetical protein
MAEQWLSIVEYARTFQVSDMTVRRRIKTGKLHAVLKEGKYFIPVKLGEARAHHEAAAAEAETERRPQVMSPYLKRPGEMTVVKAQAPAPRPQVVAREVAAREPVAPAAHELLDANVPSSLSRPLAAQDTSLVDTRALLAFCEATLKKLNESERRTVERFKSKLEALEANLVAKDHEIRALRQQTEDLQLLVKILEGKA